MNLADDNILIEWTEDLVKIGRQEKHRGGRDFVNEEEFQLYVHQLGWAKDPLTDEQGQRKPGAVKLSIDSVLQENAK